MHWIIIDLRPGTVHRTRETQGKQNKLVYGLSTDGNEFQFWRLDNSSEVSNWINFFIWSSGLLKQFISSHVAVS